MFLGYNTIYVNIMLFVYNYLEIGAYTLLLSNHRYIHLQFIFSTLMIKIFILFDNFKLILAI